MPARTQKGRNERRNEPGVPKSGHVPILPRPVAELRPSPLNDKLYRPVSPSDPDILALARSIRRHGLREPLVITLDDVILSGHRRHTACRLAGLTVVPCRVENIRSTDPQFLTRIMHTLGQKESEKGRKAISLHGLRVTLMAGPAKQTAPQRTALGSKSAAPSTGLESRR